MARRLYFRGLLAGALLLVFNNYAAAQTAANVLLVVNDASQPSRMIGEYYAQKRNLPLGNVCHVTTKTDETILRPDFDVLHGTIARCLMLTGALDRILYIVLTKGIPIRIQGTDGRGGSVASVDSELTLLYRRLTGTATPLEGPLPNPYFAGASPDGKFRSFNHKQWDFYLVTRLDGYSVDDVVKLIDRASAPATSGRIVLDGKSSWQDKGNEWLQAAADRLKADKFAGPIELDGTSKVLSDEQNVLGYYSWGSNDSAIKARQPNMSFVPGALAAMFVSSDARTFVEPPAAWTLGDWDKKDTYYAGSPQSLTGDLIRAGVTGTAGHVAEPFLDATIRPDILFPAYISGANLAEAFYLAMPYLSWQTVVIGDPLCAPFRVQSLSAEEIDRGLDPQTELPGYFSERRVQTAMRNNVKREAVTASLRAETRINHQDFNGAIEALIQATTVEPRLVQAHALLGSLYLDHQMYDQAVERYRKVIAINPNDVLSLNNLAFTIAVHQHAPQDALPFAERANQLVAANPMLRDTLAWIQHLLGRDQDAVASIRMASTGIPNNAEIRWHAAAILAAVGQNADAVIELDAALKLDPKLADSDEIRSLRQRITPNALPH